MNKQDRIVRLKEVKERTALSKSTIYLWMADGTFPKSIKLGPRSMGWRESDIDKWIADLVPGKCLVGGCND